MSALVFRITFLGPFHVGGSSPDAGLDSPVDREVPLPASSLKGLMRAQARNTLGAPAGLVSAIFGAPPRESAWTWTDAEFDEAPAGNAYARIRLADSGDGAAERGFLFLGEHLWATAATFRVEPRTALDAETLARHRLVLRAAARAVSGLGGARRRGEGWVTFADDADWTRDDTRALRALLTGVPA